MNNDNNFKEFFKNHGASVALCSGIAIVLVATVYFSYSEFSSNGSQNTQIANQSDVKSYKETTIEQTTLDLKKTRTQNTTEITTEATTNNIKSTKEEKIEPTSTTKAKEIASSEDKDFTMFNGETEMVWPVNGKIVMDYSMETAILDKTLEQYRVNDSISISAPIGTEVVAATDGIVESVFEDNKNGQTVVLNHGNGWFTTYSQLSKDVLVAVGDVVKEGDAFAKVSEPSNYSVALGSHLDFRIFKDSSPADPKLVLAQIAE